MTEEQPKEATEDRPKVFKSMTAWIGGATAVIVALGGLVTAFGGLLRHDSRQTEPKTEAAQQTTNAPVAAVEPESTAEEERASYTTGDGGTLEWVKGMWVWTDGEGNPFRYSEESNDGVTVVGKLRQDGKDIWLQWPVAGGEALQSFDNQDNWNNPVSVTISEPATTES